MRVLHVDTGREWRGGQRQVLLLARGLAARGVATAVAAPPDSPLALRARNAGLEVHPLGVRGDLDIPAAARLARLARRTGAEILHAHDARAHAALLLASPFAAFRRVVTRRAAFGRRAGPFDRLKYGRGVDRFIAVSAAVRDGLVAAGAGPDRIRVVPSGVEQPCVVSPADWRARLGLDARARVIGSVGALSREKGYDVLVAALARLDDPLAHLVLVGDGPERPPLRSLAGELGVGGRVHLPGYDDSPLEAAAGFDVYAQPSRAEGLGTAALDALALGLPVAASAVGGLAELIEPGVSGLLVPPGDPAALAAALRRLLDDSALRAALAAGAHRRAAAFTADAMVEGTLAVYRELAAGAADRMARHGAGEGRTP